MAEIVIRRTLNLIRSLQLENSFSLRRLKIDADITMMEAELRLMLGFIRDAEGSKEERFRLWVREIKALAYRIEDVIGTLVIRIASENEMISDETIIMRMLKKIIFLRKIKNSARALRLETEDIGKRFTNRRQYEHGLIRSTINDDTTSFRATLLSYYAEGEELLTGMDEGLNLLVSSMLDGSRNYQVISICGMAGIGKATLARQLCNHYAVRQQFEAIAWVHIPQKHSIMDVFLSILRQLFKNQPEHVNAFLSEYQLRRVIWDFQHQHRCLIVLDNLQSSDTWQSLRNAFPLEKTDSKILITTWSLEVAEMATTGQGRIHTMRCLTEEDSWLLFRRYVALRDGPEFNSVDSEMENVGRKLVSQCKGLPLGIVALGETFTTKYTLQQWKIAHEYTEVFERIEKVREALNSMYIELPSKLKACLPYLATFRKGTKIKPEKLYHLWMGEGLLSSDNDQLESMMHLAESYLNSLHLRFTVYVEEEEVSTATRFKSCSLHDLMHDFCLFMGRREEIFVVMEKELEQDFDSSSWTDKTRGLVMYLGNHDKHKFLLRLTKTLRCLLVRNASKNQELASHKMLSGYINCIMQLRYLSILEFDRIDFGNQSLPKGIADLVLLRYLSFTGCLLKALPPSIGNLLYLQILDLRVRTGCKMEIPNVLQKMKRLIHLYLPLTFQTRGGAELRLHGLIQLETLENFNTEECDVEDLFTLNKVRYLTINSEGNLEGLKRLIDHMSLTSEPALHSSLNVRNFDCYGEERHSVFRQLLTCPALHDLYMEGHLGKIPPYRKISKNLIKIVLSGSELQIDPMPTLEMLPKLRVLILNDDACAGQEVICSASNFPELRHLELTNLSSLERWRVEEKAMPKLSSLKIENCRKLKMLPDGLRFLTNLRELKILRMLETFKDRLCEVDGERGADMDKVPCETFIMFDDDNESS